jgi:protein involved in sex pheromone biosynthesis
MLEMLIALAIRCEEQMSNPKEGDRTCKWFWEMIQNIELDSYTDSDYFNLDGPVMVDKILTNVLERNYKHDGKGGLFPLKKAKGDQRNVEIWYQMSAYLLENYYVNGEIM